MAESALLASAQRALLRLWHRLARVSTTCVATAFARSWLLLAHRLKIRVTSPRVWGRTAWVPHAEIGVSWRQLDPVDVRNERGFLVRRCRPHRLRTAEAVVAEVDRSLAGTDDELNRGRELPVGVQSSVGSVQEPERAL